MSQTNATPNGRLDYDVIGNMMVHAQHTQTKCGVFENSSFQRCQLARHLYSYYPTPDRALRFSLPRRGRYDVKFHANLWSDDVKVAGDSKSEGVELLSAIVVFSKIIYPRIFVGRNAQKQIFLDRRLTWIKAKQKKFEFWFCDILIFLGVFWFFISVIFYDFTFLIFAKLAELFCCEISTFLKRE